MLREAPRKKDKKDETVFSPRSRQIFFSSSSPRLLPSLIAFRSPRLTTFHLPLSPLLLPQILPGVSDACADFPGCVVNLEASADLAWDCGPCSAFVLDGGNGHCERAPGCSLSGGGGGGAAATVLASSGHGRQRGGGASSQQKKAEARAASSEQKQISDVADRNAVVFNLHGEKRERERVFFRSFLSRGFFRFFPLLLPRWDRFESLDSSPGQKRRH